MTSPISAVSTAPDPTAASQVTAALSNPGGVLDKNAFLKMLVAQLQNQDPMNPMDGNAMAAQMAQFSSVEQLMNINDGITAQGTQQAAILGAIQTSGAMGTIGRDVLATGQDLIVGTGGQTSVNVNVGGVGGSGTLSIFDSTGRQVGTRDLGTLNGGMQQVSVGSAADGLPDGHYSYQLSVKDASGNDVTVQDYVRGTVDGVQTTANGVQLTAGGLTIPYTSVVQIFNN